MGTKTVDEAGAETGAEAAEAKHDGGTVDVTKKDVTETEAAKATDAADVAETKDAADEVTQAGQTGENEVTGEDADALTDDEDAELAELIESGKKSGPTGVGQGAGAVVAAVLGLVSLTGGWVGTLAGARSTLDGQLKTTSTATVAQQIDAIYGEAWQATALWAGFFALAALLIGVAVLVRPAFGAPAEPQAPWIKSVAWAGVALAVIGLLLAVLKYTDVLLALPSPPS